MTYRLTIQPEAESDLADAYRWYEKQRSGLGAKFLECVEAVFQSISEAPQLHAVTYKTVRQALVTRFPYVVCYLWEDDCVDVVAVFHGHRDPTDWRSRLT